MKMFKFFKETPLQAAEEELEEAQHQHLVACTHEEHARSIKLYNEERINRLSAYINKVKQDNPVSKLD